MKNILFFLLNIANILPVIAMESNQEEFFNAIKANNPVSVPLADEAHMQIGLGDIARSLFLLIAGAWLAHKQLPRLAGQQIEYNAPIFTKIFASQLFIVGTIGGAVGAYQLNNIIYEQLNRFWKTDHLH